VSQEINKVLRKGNRRCWDEKRGSSFGTEKGDEKNALGKEESHEISDEIAHK